MEGSKPKLCKSVSNRKSVRDETTTKPKTLDDIFNQNQALIEQINFIMDRICSMDRQVKLMENNVVMLQSSTNSIDEKLVKMKADVDGKISTHDTEISKLQYEVKTLNETVHKIVSDRQCLL
jgi:predicted RNase H-like nuclease (RuvC/YqgF family)